MASPRLRVGRHTEGVPLDVGVKSGASLESVRLNIHFCLFLGGRNTPCAPRIHRRRSLLFLCSFLRLSSLLSLLCERRGLCLFRTTSYEYVQLSRRTVPASLFIAGVEFVVDVLALLLKSLFNPDDVVAH